MITDTTIAPWAGVALGWFVAALQAPFRPKSYPMNININESLLHGDAAKNSR
jgi:hypothetical protein